MNENRQLSKKERRALKKQEKLIAKEQEKRHKLVRRVVFWSAIVLVIGVAFLGMIFLAMRSAGQNEQSGSVVAITEDDWIKGNRDAKVTLIEYSDFQCPACAHYYSLVKDLVKEFNNDIRFVYRHFPLTQVHFNAEMAARVAEAAGRQEKFWEMHDKIFENQSQWSDLRNPDSLFKGYARELGLDTAKFENDLELDDIKDKLTRDIRSAYAAGVDATPTFFLNGQQIQARNYDEFRNIIIQELNNNS